MNNNRCLFCYQPLQEGLDFHRQCSKKLFDVPVPPELPYSENEMYELGLKVVQSQMTVTGVQPKISLELANGKKRTKPDRFTIVGLWGNYILKPPTERYPQMPEVEDLTMHLAELSKIKTVPHSLIRLRSGNLAYITKRIDRTQKDKLHMEDFCQLTDRLTEHKYHGSYEQIAKAIAKFSSTPGLDVVNFFEQVLFSFLTGNADMHLKNFSLYDRPGIGYALTPAYDMLATALINPLDTEELALTLNGKKRNITKNDFIDAFNTLKLDAKQQINILHKFTKYMPDWFAFIDVSFLDTSLKEALKELIKKRYKRLTAH